jgi:hypothetical protein
MIHVEAEEPGPERRQVHVHEHAVALDHATGDQNRVDPLETLGIIPVGPLPCRGWGDIPDQYGRRWDGDDGSSRMPKTPNGLADLTPILPGWGPGGTARRVTR